MDRDVSYTSGQCDIHQALEAFEDQQGIIVDTTASRDTLRDVHMHVIRQTPHTIVTANKNPLSLY